MAKWKKSKGKDNMTMSGGAGGFWFFGFIGAMIYYWHTIESFGSFFVVLFKAAVWPVYVVNGLHQLLAL